VITMYTHLLMNTTSQPRPHDRELGSALRQHRHTRRMSQHQLALRLGVTQQTIARWERGSPPRADMIPIIHAELGGRAIAPQGLARVIELPIVETEDSANPERDALQDAFLDACVEMVLRRERLPNELMLLAARYIGLPLDGDRS